MSERALWAKRAAKLGRLAYRHYCTYDWRGFDAFQGAANACHRLSFDSPFSVVGAVTVQP